MKINWKVRIKNKAFWVAIIPMVLLLAQQVCGMFGVQIEVAWLSEQLLAIVGTVFGVLALLGIVNDPTTKGLSDSTNALNYDAPKADEPSLELPAYNTSMADHDDQGVG